MNNKNNNMPDKTIMSQGTTLSFKLSEQGISRDQSSNWQKIAFIPEKGGNPQLTKNSQLQITLSQAA